MKYTIAEEVVFIGVTGNDTYLTVL